MNLILCGLPGSGKTTLGEAAAEALGRQFYDTDRLVEEEYRAKTGLSLVCREIFRREGEPYFRSLERDVLDALQPCRQAVIALGGGCIDPAVKELGYVVYLKASMRFLFERMIRDGLPAYLDSNDPFGSFERIALQRIPLYKRIADAELDVENLSVQEFCSWISAEGSKVL